jgi:hypothetical protein
MLLRNARASVLSVVLTGACSGPRAVETAALPPTGSHSGVPLASATRAALHTGNSADWAPPGPATPPSAAPSAESAPAASAARPPAGDTPAATADAPTPPPLPRDSEPALDFFAEQPFKLYERPRPEGEVHAAVEDEQLARWNIGGTGAPEFISNRSGYHPAARVVVDTTVLSGNLPARTPRDRRTGRGAAVLSQQQVLADARKYGYWPFRLCYQDGLRREQKLEGQTIIRISLNASGRVSAARLVQTKLEDREVATCLTERSKQLRFSPAPGRRVDVRLSVKLWPGDAPVPLAGPPSDDTPEKPGRLDAARAAQALGAIHPELRRCYQEGLLRDPGLWGRLQLRIDQDRDGRILDVCEDESRFPDPKVVRCMLAAVRAVNLPKPKGGELSFVYAVRLGRMPTPDSNQ